MFCEWCEKIKDEKHRKSRTRLHCNCDVNTSPISSTRRDALPEWKLIYLDEKRHRFLWTYPSSISPHDDHVLLYVHKFHNILKWPELSMHCRTSSTSTLRFFTMKSTWRQPQIETRDSLKYFERIQISERLQWLLVIDDRSTRTLFNNIAWAKSLYFRRGRTWGSTWTSMSSSTCTERHILDGWTLKQVLSAPTWIVRTLDNSADMRLPKLFR